MCAPSIDRRSGGFKFEQSGFGSRPIDLPPDGGQARQKCDPSSSLVLDKFLMYGIGCYAVLFCIQYGASSQLRRTMEYNLYKGRFQKPQSRKLSVKGGGTPLSVNFFLLGFLEPAVCEGEGEYPPFPFRKNPLKIGPKTVFYGQKTPFLAKKFPFYEGVPPFSVNFLATDRP